MTASDTAPMTTDTPTPPPASGHTPGQCTLHSTRLDTGEDVVRVSPAAQGGG